MRFLRHSLGLTITFTFCCILLTAGRGFAQSVASGTIEGAVVDPTGGVIAGAAVELQNPVTGFRQTAVKDPAGMFRFTNVPFNNYHIEVTQQGFASAAQDLGVRTTVTVSVKMTLTVAGVSQEVR